MTPVKFPEANAILSSDQASYEPLPVHVFPGRERRMAFCLQLTEDEVHEIINTQRIWLQQLTFGAHFQPILLTTQKPDDMPSNPPTNPYSKDGL